MTKPASNQPETQSDALQFTVSYDEIPDFLAHANDAINKGDAEKARSLITDDNIENILAMTLDNPSRVNCTYVLATVLSRLGNISKARHCYETITDSEHKDLIFNELAHIMLVNSHITEAIEYQQKALDANPENTELMCNLGMYLFYTDKKKQGLEILKQAVEKAPTSARVRSRYLFYLHYQSEPDRKMIFAEHKKWGQIHCDKNIGEKRFHNTVKPGRKLRIGYISPNFAIHSVAYFFEPILDNHNHKKVEVFGYGNVRSPDMFTERLKDKFDHYRNIFALDTDQVVAMIERDKIDILIDLAGHTDGNSLLVLAKKPAPIQATYLGYPNTTGLSTIDYRITDLVSNPEGSEAFYTEELVRLDKRFLCYRPSEFTVEVSKPAFVKKGHITFGSFNDSRKITPQIIDIWAQILKRNEGSQLLLKFHSGNDKSIQNYYRNEFASRDIDPERIELHGRKPLGKHLELYKQVDIGLDTSPYNGTTITIESLWMGVPVITLYGQSHSSRVGLSILSGVDMEHFAASNEEEYIMLATAIANNRDALAKMRSSMRGHLVACGLCDARHFTRALEGEYQKMWKKWCSQQPNL
jgi:protein O-GlcNAc transferase